MSEKHLPSTKTKLEVAGRTFEFETGKVARQANGSVTIQSGETLVFASACMSAHPMEVDFLPLRVDYQEKFSAAGKTLGGFLKREGRPTEPNVLTSRLIDRPLRPMFPEGFFYDTQLLAYVWSYDGQNAPDALGICAAGLALHLSDIPFPKAVAGVRVGRIAGNYIINPTIDEQKESDLDLLLAGTEDAILMIEGFCDFLSEDEVIESVLFGHKAIKALCQHFDELREKAGKPKVEFTPLLPSKELTAKIEELFTNPITEALAISTKLEREEAQNAISKRALDELENSEDSEYSARYIKMAIKKLSSNLMRKKVLKEKVRIDGRSTTEIRPITVEQSFLPRTHGSSLFTRGETQAVAVCTLGNQTMGQRFETLTGEGARSFYLQYSFPPFSVGEVGRVGPPARREVGHGMLAERALAAAVPSQDLFPYVIRLESNITESNGSSSMASVCGGCLSLMDAGVPIKAPISGIAMGLILEGSDYMILSDILGAEDALGDMDLKIAGSREAITAFQMDIKVEGITPEILKAALAQAKDGRVHILNKMLEACPKARTELSVYAPKIRTIRIHPSKIGIVIGPGGKQIREITDTTGAEVNIDDSVSDEYAIVSLSSVDAKAIDDAEKWVVNLTSDVEIGKTYQGKIVSVVAFGVFVEIFSKQGLCHISELDHGRIDDMFNSDFKEGQMIEVKVLDINDRGQIRLSRKILLPKAEREAEPASS